MVHATDILQVVEGVSIFVLVFVVLRMMAAAQKRSEIRDRDRR
jgi:hypothetical protein